jgi:hypothetical protein
MDQALHQQHCIGRNNGLTHQVHQGTNTMRGNLDLLGLLLMLMVVFLRIIIILMALDMGLLM